jgi:predicted RNase H-like HicB family nuclease
MRYAVGVETREDGQTLAHVLDLPGCFSRGATPQEALDRLFRAIPAYWDWLRDHGASAPPPHLVEPVTLGVVELLRGSAPQAAQDRSALFEMEAAPATPPQVALCLDRLAFSRADLLDLLAGLDPAAWTAPRADGSTVADRIAGLAAAERWTVERLGPLPAAPPAADGLAELEATRAAVVARLATLSLEECATVYILDNERWSVRKVLRRMLEQEFEQVAQIGLLLHADSAARTDGD